MTTKRPPALSWQDKAILITIPVVVLAIFILGNYYTQDPKVEDAAGSQLTGVIVRDSGFIVSLYPQTATDSVKFRVKDANSSTEYDFVYNITGSDTFKFEPGKKVQFYGQYNYDMRGGTVTTPYKGKSGRYDGWLIYNNNRYTAANNDQQEQQQ